MVNTFNKVFFAIFLMMHFTSCAQKNMEIAKESKDHNGFIPKGWRCAAIAKGDFNNDKHPDLVLIISRLEIDHINEITVDSVKVKDTAGTLHRVVICALYNSSSNSYYRITKHDSLFPTVSYYEGRARDDMGGMLFESFDSMYIKSQKVCFRFAGMSGSIAISEYKFGLHNGELILDGLTQEDIHRVSADYENYDLDLTTRKAKYTKGNLEKAKKQVKYFPIKDHRPIKFMEITNPFETIGFEEQKDGFVITKMPTAADQ